MHDVVICASTPDYERCELGPPRKVRMGVRRSVLSQCARWPPYSATVAPMWNLVSSAQGVVLARPARRGRRISGGILTVLGVLWVVGNISIAASGDSPGPFGLILGAALTVGGIMLSRTALRASRPVAALLSSTEVTGGILVRVMDTGNDTHELLTDPSTLQALTAQLTA